MNAPNPQTVRKLFNVIYMTRHDKSQDQIEQIAQDFGLENPQAEQLFDSISNAISLALYTGEPESVVQEIEQQGITLDNRLVNFIVQIFQSYLPRWQEASAAQRISLPRFVDVDWRVDMKTASQQLSKMAVPTMFVDLQIEDQPSRVGMVPDVKHVNFELSKEALQTMLDGLGKIRDQLMSVTGSETDNS